MHVQVIAQRAAMIVIKFAPRSPDATEPLNNQFFRRSPLASINCSHRCCRSDRLVVLRTALAIPSACVRTRRDAKIALRQQVTNRHRITAQILFNQP